ncbi:MAG: hypothetical protein M3N50_07500 [Pseudomonadota bacterium]|nr:hypothetical protein [Pseudomonadota bacterium]
MWKKLRHADPAKFASIGSHRNSVWHAVSIVSTDQSCEAGRSLRAARFLSRDAPVLPLDGCTQRISCACAYKHHADRRGLSRRRVEITGLRYTFQGGEDRRKHYGRRETD